MQCDIFHLSYIYIHEAKTRNEQNINKNGSCIPYVPKTPTEDNGNFECPMNVGLGVLPSFASFGAYYRIIQAFSWFSLALKLVSLIPLQSKTTTNKT